MVNSRPPVPPQLDHLVYATPDLAAGLARLEELFGLRFLPGGSHPAWGTRNALLPLSPSTYLEIIGPDPGSTATTPPALFGIATLSAPRLATWAARGRDLERLVERARARGIELGTPRRGQRRRPDGSTLSWELTDPFASRADGLLPFFIDWPGADHPARSAVADVQLVELEARHPDPAAVQAELDFLGLALSVTNGPTPALQATFRSPRGTVVLT